MACWASASATICVNTLRCCGKKKSSAFRDSMAAFSALLSRMMAPRMERSASILLGSGFSMVVSAGMMRRKKSVLVSLSLRYWSIFPAGRQVRIGSSVVCVPLRRRDALIVRVCSTRVNRSACESRRKTGEKLFAEYGKMLLQKNEREQGANAKHTQDESMAEHQGRGTSMVDRGISARECWPN